MDNFLVIAITPDYFFKGEAERINEILANGEARFIHIRKPFSTKKNLEELLNKITPEFYPRIKLHDHFELNNIYGLGGIHLNSRNPKPIQITGTISQSLHSVEEMTNVNHLDYFFISPIFDSISKRGYKAAFNLNDLSKIIRGKKAIALGGVTPDKYPMLKSLGFYGAALSGYLFQNLTNKNH